MREIVHLQAGQCGNQIGAKVRYYYRILYRYYYLSLSNNYCTYITYSAVAVRTNHDLIICKKKKKFKPQKMS